MPIETSVFIHWSSKMIGAPRLRVDDHARPVRRMFPRTRPVPRPWPKTGDFWRLRSPGTMSEKRPEPTWPVRAFELVPEPALGEERAVQVLHRARRREVDDGEQRDEHRPVLEQPAPAQVEPDEHHREGHAHDRPRDRGRRAAGDDEGADQPDPRADVVDGPRER